MCPTPLKTKFPNALLVLEILLFFFFFKVQVRVSVGKDSFLKILYFLAIPQQFSLLLGFQKGMEWVGK